MATATDVERAQIISEFLASLTTDGDELDVLDGLDGLDLGDHEVEHPKGTAVDHLKMPT